MAQYRRQLKNRIKWFYKFDLNGRTYRSRCVFDTKQEAKISEAHHLKDIIDFPTNRNKNSDIYLIELIAERLEYLITRKSRKYYKENRHYLEYLERYIGNIKIKEIKKQTITKMLSEYSINGHYATNAFLRCIKALFNFGINILEINLPNPCKAIPFYSVDKNLKYIPSDDEIEQVLAICDNEQKLLIRFVMETGARISEALSLRYLDITDDYVVLFTRKSKNSNLTARKVPLPACLLKLKSPPNKNEFVFGRWADQPKFLAKKIKQLNQKPWNWHGLRHRYASKLSQDGLPIFTIMNYLGHSNISTTQIYLRMLV